MRLDWERSHRVQVYGKEREEEAEGAGRSGRGTVHASLREPLSVHGFRLRPGLVLLEMEGDVGLRRLERARQAHHVAPAVDGRPEDLRETRAQSSACEVCRRGKGRGGEEWSDAQRA